MDLFQTRLQRPIKNENQPLHPHISFLGRFSSGIPAGNFWIRMIGNGFMHGKFEQNGEATGDNLAFIYPDMETAFYGKFEKFVMKSAHESQVLETECDENGMRIVTKYDAIVDPEFYYDPPTNVSFGAGPPGVPDPYERKSVKLTTSSIPNTGQGVIALVDFPRDRITCMYSGYLYDAPEQQVYFYILHFLKLPLCDLYFMK